MPPSASVLHVLLTNASRLGKKLQTSLQLSSSSLIWESGNSGPSAGYVKRDSGGGGASQRVWASAAPMLRISLPGAGGINTRSAPKCRSSPRTSKGFSARWPATQMFDKLRRRQKSSANPITTSFVHACRLAATFWGRRKSTALRSSSARELPRFDDIRSLNTSRNSGSPVAPSHATLLDVRDWKPNPSQIRLYSIPSSI